MAKPRLTFVQCGFRQHDNNSTPLSNGIINFTPKQKPAISTAELRGAQGLAEIIKELSALSGVAMATCVL